VDPDPGGQKGPTKVEIFFLKFMLLRVGWHLLRAEEASSVTWTFFMEAKG
jgi:hypothetical protein